MSVDQDRDTKGTEASGAAEATSPATGQAGPEVLSEAQLDDVSAGTTVWVEPPANEDKPKSVRIRP